MATNPFIIGGTPAPTPTPSPFVTGAPGGTPAAASYGKLDAEGNGSFNGTTQFSMKDYTNFANSYGSTGNWEARKKQYLDYYGVPSDANWLPAPTSSAPTAPAAAPGQAPAPAPADGAASPFSMVGGGTGAPAPGGIVGAAPAPPAATGIVGGAGSTPATPERGQLRSAYMKNNGDMAAVKTYMVQNQYTPEIAAQEMGIPLADMYTFLGLSPGQQLTAPPPGSAPSTPASTGIVTGSQSSASQLGSPTSWNVTPDQTVEGRINSIINPNNPLQQQAKSRSLVEANSRGLGNTSMAVTAGESALYDAAMPIAQADAATFSKAAGWNAQQQNEFAARNVESQNSFFLADKQVAGQKDIALINRETQIQLTKLDGENRTAAAAIQTEHETLLQTNAEAGKMFNQGIAAVNNINLNDKMDATTKTQAVAQVWQNVQSGFKVLGATSGLNLAQELNFSGYPGFDDQNNYIGFGAEDVEPAATPTTAVDAPQVIS